jgi:cytoskeletal protein CcmA (bactofilin family)
MTPLDLELVPEPPAAASTAVLAARHRRALVVGLGGGRDADSPLAKSSFAKSSFAEPRARPASVATHGFDSAAAAALARGVDAPSHAQGAPHPARRPAPAPASSAPTANPRLDDALVVPAGALVRGYVRCRSLLLVGDLVGNVHCTAGPVVIRSGANLVGRLVAAGDVYVCGAVGDRDGENDSGGGRGGAVITTQGKLTLAPGARVHGDVRSGRLDLYDGAMLHGVAKACED